MCIRDRILTGSAIPKDRDAIHHSGTGRIARLRMWPMSLAESGESTGAVSLSDLFEGKFEPAECNTSCLLYTSGADANPPLVVTPSAAPKGYYQHVPLFSDVLDVVAGRAPLIVEYKFSNNRAWDERSEELMEKGHALLEAYDGPYVIESFHPGAVNWYKEHHPEVCRRCV